MGRTLGKGLPPITIHANSKRGPWGSRDAEGFTIAEGWFKPQDKERGASRFAAGTQT